MKNKRVIGRDLLLAYTYVNATFETHTNASKLHMGAVISQKWQAILYFFSKDEQRQAKLHHNLEITPFHSGIS